MREILIENFFMIFLTIGYTLYTGMHLYKLKKHGGALLKTYVHKSGVKMIGYAMIAIGFFYVVMFFFEKDKTTSKYVTMSLFFYFVVAISYFSIQDIKLYENGLYYSGKFTPYSNMKSIERVKKSGVQINLNSKGLANLIYLSKIEDDNDFVGMIRKKLKITKKTKKK